jgi:hypothetical protein
MRLPLQRVTVVGIGAVIVELQEDVHRAVRQKPFRLLEALQALEERLVQGLLITGGIDEDGPVLDRGGRG